MPFHSSPACVWQSSFLTTWWPRSSWKRSVAKPFRTPSCLVTVTSTRRRRARAFQWSDRSLTSAARRPRKELKEWEASRLLGKNLPRLIFGCLTFGGSLGGWYVKFKEILTGEEFGISRVLWADCERCSWVWKVLAASFSLSWHTRASGQSSSLLSDLTILPLAISCSSSIW